MVRSGRFNWSVVRAMINFGEWLPDQPDFSNAGVVEATNVVPASSGYRSLNNFEPYSGAATGTILGIYSVKASDGSGSIFAGDSTKLYEFDTTDSSLTDISKVGGYTLDASIGERWRFVNYGDYVIAAGGIGESIQKFHTGTDAIYNDLSASAPKADFIAVVREFVWTANVDSGSGRVPWRCQWSGFDDITSWTVGSDQSDFQDTMDCGAITGLVGGEYATVLMERAIVRATYTGPPLIWQFDKVETARGCKIAGSVCNVGHNVFYLADDGFMMFDGQQSTAIGAEKIDAFFQVDHDSSYKHLMTATTDPQSKLAIWSYVSTSSTNGRPDKLLIYNYFLRKWSIAEIAADLLSPLFTAGYTLEGLDTISTSIETLPASMDSALYKGGQYLFGGAFGDKIYTFTGSPLTGTITTGEAAVSMGQHSIVTRIYPHHEGGTVEMSVGLRGTPTDTVTFQAGGSTNADGFVPFRAADRYHRVKMIISGDWSFAHGIDIEARKVGRR